jgi:gliding motility-associated-like protein
VIVSQPESGCGVTSEVAAVTINEAPEFTTQPSSSEICLNGNVDILEVAYNKGTGTPTYRWYSNITNSNTGGAAISGATDPSYNPITNVVGETFYYAEISFDSGGCDKIVSDVARVKVVEQVTIDPVPAAQTICIGGTAAEFSVTYTGGAGTASYQWYSNTANNNTSGNVINDATSSTYIPPASTTAGDFYYYAEVTLSGNGCNLTKSDVFEVNVILDPIIDAQPLASQALCQNATPADLAVAVSGGTTSVKTYQWYRNSTNNTSSGTAIVGQMSSSFTPPATTVGTLYYYVIVSQPESGCGVTSEVAAVTINEAPEFTTQPSSSEICLNGNVTILEVAYNKGTGTPTYQWYSNITNSNTGGAAISGATDPSYNPLTNVVGETFYYAEISFDSGGCDKIVSDIARVKVVEQVTIDPVPAAQTICIGGTAAEFSVTYTGGAGTASYQWYSNTANNNTSGNVINDATSSTYIPPASTTAGDFYYYAEVTLSGNGCNLTKSDVFEVNVILDPIIDAQPLASQALCQNATPADLAVAVSGGTTSVKTYQWYRNSTNNTSSGTAIVGQMSSSFTPPATTVGTLYYYVIVSQPESGCGVTSEVAAVTINEAPEFTTQPSSSEICLNGNVDILEVAYNKGTGTPTYRWYSNITNSNTGGAAISGATDPSYNPITNVVGETFYYAEISFDSGGCDKIVSDVARVIINQIPAINNAQITIYSQDTFSFNPNTITSNIIPTSTKYTWSAPSFTPIGSILGESAETTPQDLISQTLENTGISPIVVTYTIIPSTTKCIGNPFILEVTVNPNISSNTLVTNISCFEANDGEISTTIEGGIPFATGNPYLISWSGPNGFASTNGNIGNLGAGIYTLRIEDSTGFFITEQWQVTKPDLLVIAKDLEKNISCFQGNDGTIEVTFSGGTTPYTFNWTTTNGSGIVLNEKNQNNLTAGTYTLQVTDKNNCITSATFVLSEPEGLNIETTNKQDILCFGDATGAISINVTGGTGIEISPGVFDYNYNWSGPNGFTSTSKNVNNLILGTYTVAVTDNLGCTTSTDIVINQSPEIEINYTKTDVSCYGETDGALEVLVTGGATPYQISWSNFANGFSQSNLSAATYNATVTDANGCVKQVSIDIIQPIFFIDPVVTPISCNGENDGSVNLNLTGGVTPIRVIWDDDPGAGVQRNNLSAGTYKLLIIDSDPKQCPIERIFTFTNPPAMALSSTVIDAIDCAIENSGSIDLSVSGGTAPYTFAWSTGEISEDLNDIGKGDYFVEIKDANGCIVNRSFSIFRQDPIEISFVESFITNCETKTVTKRVEAIVSGGFLPHILSWSSGTVSGTNNSIITTTQPGAYVLTVTDNNGCIQEKSILINNIPTIGDPDFRYNAFALNTYDYLSIEDPIQFTNLSSGNYTSLAWDFGDGSPIVKEETPIHTYDDVGIYTVKLTVDYDTGCSYTVEREVPITIGYTLINPNAFTPNGDGYNETIRPNFIGFTEIEMAIYDHWGTLIYFEKGSTLKGWNGTIKNTPAENGNYVMVVKGITFYQKEIKTTTIATLLK